MKHPGTINFFNNSTNVEFEWSEKNFNKIKNILKNYPSTKSQSAVMPVLQIAQKQN